MPPEAERDQWFNAQVLPHAGTLRGWLRGRFPGLSDVDDVVQESLARVWRARGTAAIASGRAFLFTTARNLALDLARRDRVVAFEPLTDSQASFVPTDGPGVCETVAKTQELEILTQAIQSLPDRCRQVLTLRKIYGLPQKEIAAQLGIAEHTVEAQVANGMRRCAAFLARHGLP